MWNCRHSLRTKDVRKTTITHMISQQKSKKVKVMCKPQLSSANSYKEISKDYLPE